METILLVLIVLILAGILGLGVVQFTIARRRPINPQSPLTFPVEHREPREAVTVYTQPVRAMNGEAVIACEHCHAPLPKGTIRTHDGLWRCADHKPGRM